jgi:hypothetical protein
MNSKEFRTKVIGSSNAEWFLQQKCSLSYPHLNLDFSLEGVPAIYDFVYRHAKGYAEMGDIPPEFMQDKRVLEKVQLQIIDLVLNNDVNQYSWDECFGNLKRKQFFFPGTSEANFLKTVYFEKPNYYKAAYEYMTGSIRNISSRDNFNGYLMAYEFCTKDASEIFIRKNNERKSLSKMRSDFEEKLNEVETNTANFIYNVNSRSSEYSTQIDELKKEKESLFGEWFKNVKEGHEKFCQETDLKIREFEDLYQQKLKLEAPANYWNVRANRLRKEGVKWLGWLLACVSITIGLLIWLLNKLPDGTLDKIFQNNGLAIKWSIALITLISFCAFAIRIFSKLTFSSFHLARDAEEREQLTYVYLALQKEKGIDQTERHLIMQSLFSRADSGLLKEEASPTMPGNIVDQVVKR